MQKRLLLWVLLFSSIFAWAKKAPENNAIGLEYFYHREVPMQFASDFRLNTAESDSVILEAISTQLLKLGSDETLKIIAKRSNAHSTHLLLQQHIDAYPVYAAYFKVNFLNNGEILSISNGLFDISESVKAQSTKPSELEQKALVSKWLADKPFNKEALEIERNWLFLNGKLQPIIKVIVNIPAQVYYSEWLLSASGEAISEKNLNRYQTRADATFWVFSPDPLTSAQKYYGGLYIDSFDTDLPILNNQLQSHKMDVLLNAGIYELESPFVKMQDLSPPNIAIPSSVDGLFKYGRGEDSFEACNAYFHIQKIAQRIVSLGFNNLLIDQVLVDGNGLSGNDQSIFTPSNPPRINFGEGGVDDAEDADVIIHEYGHYISHAAAPFSNDGFERLGLDEALGDFFAASYSKAISLFRWYDIFTWDGHNEYWNGRTAIADKKYPEDIISGSIHSNGEIFSSAMMEIHDLLGRDKCEILLIQALYSFSANMSMPDAGDLILQSDSVLYNGEHYCEIFNILNKYGLCSSDLISTCLIKDASLLMPPLSDFSICPGDSAQLMNFAQYNSSFQYIWTPEYRLAYLNSPVPTIFPDSSTEYQLKMVSKDGRYNTKSIKVSVEKCELKINNTAAFANATGNLNIELPERLELRPKWIRLINIEGKIIQEWQIDSSSELWQLSPENLATGVYILQIRRNNGAYLSEKLLRFKP